MKLKRQLGAFDVFSIASGAMISSGLFILPALAYKEAGTGVILSYLFAGIMMLPALFSKMELATALPKAGGTYFFSERILGSAAGVVDGFAAWFSLCMKSAFALIGIGAFATLLYPNVTEWEIKLIAAGACLIFGLLNLFSVKASGKVQIVLVGSLLLILFVFVVLGYRKVNLSHFDIQTTGLDWNAIIATTGMVFISYGGLTKVASIAEEVRDLRKNLVKSTVLAFVTVQTLYLLVLFIIVGVMPSGVLLQSLTPVSDAVRYIFNSKGIIQTGVLLTALGGMLAFITTANAGIMAASRSPMAMSRDGLIPAFISKVSAKRKTPLISTIITTGFMLVIILVLPIVKLVKVASLFQLLLFTMVNISVIIIRTSKLSNYKPTFRTPLYPVPQIIGIIAYLFLIIKMGTFTIFFAIGFVIIAISWFFLYARKRVKRKSALVHMIENISNPEFMKGEKEIEVELLDILIDRNEIIEDRFDQVIRQSPAIDYKNTITRETLFHDLAGIISKKWPVSKQGIEIKLQKREEESSTLLFPGVAVPHAVPHVIVEGCKCFDIILVRNKFGIIWNNNNDIVYTAFCLIGTRDERNFHLKCLAAIAQILIIPEFHKEWHKAKNEHELRTAILLTNRRRN